MITILWQNEEAKGYMDYIPSNWFLQIGRTENRIHDFVGPRTGRYEAKCDVTVTEHYADLNYEKYAKFNHKHGSFLGVLRIEFKSSIRNTVSHVLWKDEGEEAFKSYPAVIQYVEDDQDYEDVLQKFEKEVAESEKLSSEERKKRLASAPKKPKQINLTTMGYRRNPDVVAEVLFAAKGICQNCNENAPFLRATNGEPYLEVHHKKPLSEDGEDTVENAVALCPNCHREKHHGRQ